MSVSVVVPSVLGGWSTSSLGVPWTRVESLHYCLGHHAATPDLEISIVLNAASAFRLADFCPFIETC